MEKEISITENKKGELNLLLKIIFIGGIIGTIVNNSSEIINYQLFYNEYFEIFCVVVIVFAVIHIFGIIYTLTKKTLWGIWIIFGNIICSSIILFLLNKILDYEIFDTQKIIINSGKLIIIPLILLIQKNGESAWSVLSKNTKYNLFEVFKKKVTENVARKTADTQKIETEKTKNNNSDCKTATTTPTTIINSANLKVMTLSQMIFRKEKKNKRKVIAINKWIAKRIDYRILLVIWAALSIAIIGYFHVVHDYTKYESIYENNETILEEITPVYEEVVTVYEEDVPIYEESNISDEVYYSPENETLTNKKSDSRNTKLEISVVVSLMGFVIIGGLGYISDKKKDEIRNRNKPNEQEIRDV